jgi:two-component system sensor histidine kinase SenX3
VSNDIHDDLLWQRALASLATGFIICYPDGSVIYSDHVVKFGQTGFAQRVLIERTVNTLIAQAKQKQFGEQELEFFGPPRSYFLLRSLPLGNHDNPPFMITVEDISQRKRLDEMRRDFVANVSHELKTPVGAIVLLGEALTQAEDESTRSRLATRILQEGDRLARLVTDLLDLSKIERPGDKQYEPVDLVALVSETLEQMESLVASAHMQLEFSHNKPEMIVYGLRTELASALSNLIDNAVKYSDTGKTVHIELKELTDRVLITVRDEGIGIPKRDLSRIFERFYRVDADRSRATGGTGLGLSIVKHVVENHQGTITVDSIEGEGTTFFIELPKGEA